MAFYNGIKTNAIKKVCFDFHEIEITNQIFLFVQILKKMTSNFG